MDLLPRLYHQELLMYFESVCYPALSVANITMASYRFLSLRHHRACHTSPTSDHSTSAGSGGTTEGGTSDEGIAEHAGVVTGRKSEATNINETMQ